MIILIIHNRRRDNMGLSQNYLITTKNLGSLVNSLVSAKAPERFTNKFLEDLGFKSSNDRLYIGVFKSLGLLDESGLPTPRYHQFLDQSETGKVLALGIQEAYEDLFTLNKNAQNMTVTDVKGKFKTLTQGQKSDKVVGLMANTFKALCDIADWSTPKIESKTIDSIKTGRNQVDDSLNDGKSNKESFTNSPTKDKEMNLHYNIQIHLPETTNMLVYDAIFQSLKKHLF